MGTINRERRNADEFILDRMTIGVFAFFKTQIRAAYPKVVAASRVRPLCHFGFVMAKALARDAGTLDLGFVQVRHIDVD